MDRQWRKTGAVSRTVLHMSISDLGHMSTSTHLSHHQAGHQVYMRHDSSNDSALFMLVVVIL